MWNICVTYEHGYDPFCSHHNPVLSSFMTYHRDGTLVEKKLTTIPKHISSSPVFSGIRVAQSLALYV